MRHRVARWLRHLANWLDGYETEPAAMVAPMNMERIRQDVARRTHGLNCAQLGSYVAMADALLFKQVTGHVPDSIEA